MKNRNKLIESFQRRIKKAIVEVFDNPIGRPAKKAIITVVGVCITALGVLLIIFPGPAFLLIPVGLAILALEYPIARKWLRKSQTIMTATARKLDTFFDRRKV